MNDKTVRRWRKERDAAVASLDLKTFKAFYNKWLALGVYNKSLPANDKVTEIAMYKMAANITTMPEDIKDRARVWLAEHGCSERL